jgi:hypothetical protein
MGRLDVPGEPPTLEEIKGWGATTDVVRAGTAFGLGRNRSYDLARTGEFPVRMVKIGRTYRVVVAELIAVLEASVGSPQAA